MNKAKINQLAELLSEENAVSDKIKNFVLTKLSRKELLFLAFYLKKTIARKTVYVESDINIDNKLKTSIKKMFDGKNIIFRINDNLYTGLKVIIDDTIIDLSVKNYISETVNLLKKTL